MSIFGTTELTYQIEQLIQEDTSFLILVSPYLKLNRRLKAKMEMNFAHIPQILFLYRENQLNQIEHDWLTRQANVTLIPIENLHAKIYLNEHRCLITSMNLYEYSQVNNHEIGIEVCAKDDWVSDHNEDYLNVLEEINLMLLAQGFEYDFQKILDLYNDFSVGTFFKNAMNKFNLQGKGHYYEDCYLNFCDWARNTVHFEKDELYQDGSAILRATNLGRKRFDLLKDSITSDILTAPRM